MSTLTDFLLARIAEDEAVARAVIATNHGERERYAERGGGPDDAETDFDFEGPVDGPSGWAAIYVGPARVLAECEAKRGAIAAAWDDHARIESEWGSGKSTERLSAEDDNPAVVEWLASVYADHPDYLEEWRP